MYNLKVRNSLRLFPADFFRVICQPLFDVYATGEKGLFGVVRAFRLPPLAPSDAGCGKGRRKSVTRAMVLFASESTGENPFSAGTINNARESASGVDGRGGVAAGPNFVPISVKFVLFAEVCGIMLLTAPFPAICCGFSSNGYPHPQKKFELFPDRFLAPGFDQRCTTLLRLTINHLIPTNCVWCLINWFAFVIYKCSCLPIDLRGRFLINYDPWIAFRVQFFIQETD